MSQDTNRKNIVIAGGGPAGLRAAEVAAEAGADVVVLEAKRFIGRKFLVAGKSGLNLTNAEPMPDFRRKYSGPEEQWEKILGDFDNTALREWAGRLGFETFESSGGKVFPDPMKAAPLLRAWIKRLRDLGVEFRFHCRVTEIDNREIVLASGELIPFSAAILCFGGASWPSTGSDGSWTELLEPHHVEVTPFSPANCGWEVDWPAPITEQMEGQPVKNIVARCGDFLRAGELTITRYGLEGGPVYHLGPVLRLMSRPEITLDLKPDFSQEEVKNRLRNVKRNFVREAKRRLNLSEPAGALLKYLPHLGPWRESDDLAEAVKSCPIRFTGPRPLAEAISTAGGVRWKELDNHLMLKKLPGVFVAGEMIDWEAPTGGYLLQGCFATGQLAARGALEFAG